MQGIRRAFLFLILFVLLCCAAPSKSNPIPNIGWNRPVIVYIDESFSNDENDSIYYAMKSWEIASNGKVQFIPFFHTKRPGDLERFWLQRNIKSEKEGSVFIWNIDKDNRNDVSNNLYSKTNGFKGLDGVWDKEGNVLIFKNISNYFSWVVLHEFGHVLGLKHNSENYTTVMHPNAKMGCITQIDAHQLCAIYNCRPTPECTTNESELLERKAAN